MKTQAEEATLNCHEALAPDSLSLIFLINLLGDGPTLNITKEIENLVVIKHKNKKIFNCII